MKLSEEDERDLLVKLEYLAQIERENSVKQIIYETGLGLIVLSIIGGFIVGFMWLCIIWNGWPGIILLGLMILKLAHHLGMAMIR